MNVGRNDAIVAWLATASVPTDAWPGLRSMLDDAERARADQFRFARDRDAYVAAHALARGYLALLTGRPPAGFTFQPGSHGKPEAVCLPPEPRIRINITHTRGLAAAAIVVDHDIGCDAECMSPAAPLDIADGHFAPAECADLRALPPSAASERFYALWTLKEAYLKAVGRGLSGSLHAAQFRFHPFTVAFSADVPDRPDAWYFDRYTPDPEHRVAVAVRHPTPDALTVVAGPADLRRILAMAAGSSA